VQCFSEQASRHRARSFSCSLREMPPRVLSLVEHTSNENYAALFIIKKEMAWLINDASSHPRTLAAQP